MYVYMQRCEMFGRIKKIQLNWKSVLALDPARFIMHNLINEELQLLHTLSCPLYKSI